MPEITDSTPREDYTIKGKTFAIPQPYAEGHVLSAGEAGALNQTFAENLRNNFASKVAEALDADSFDQDAFQGKLDDYASGYEFGVRSGGGSRDPVQTEAMNIARGKVRDALKAKNKSATAAQVTELAQQVLAKNPQILELARQRVESAKDIGVDLSGIGTDSGAAPAPTETPAPTAGKGKAAAPADA